VGKDRAVSAAEQMKLEQVKFKKKGDLLTFAAKHPGALSGFFLAGVYAKLSKGLMLTRSKQLRAASVAAWVDRAGLTGVRDVREVLTLGYVMDCISKKELAQAMDILAQRILAIQSAKRKGGTWERAEMLELTPTSGAAMAPGGMLQLTAG